MDLDPAQPVELRNEGATGDAEFLILEARPIGEPVVQHGPFVMTSREEIMQAFSDYQRTEFGRWPWKVWPQRPQCSLPAS